MTRVRFGIIGCGGIARKAFLPALAASDLAEVAAVASRSREGVDELTRSLGSVPVVEGYSELLRREDVDAVYIATPTGLHAEWIVAAAEAGKHVLCEKTLATNLEETR